MAAPQQDVEALIEDRGYEAGFVTNIESETIAPGLDEDVIRFISKKKNETEWMTEWRLEAFRQWHQMPMPNRQQGRFPPIDFHANSYFSLPKSNNNQPQGLDAV